MVRCRMDGCRRGGGGDWEREWPDISMGRECEKGECL